LTPQLTKSDGSRASRLIHALDDKHVTGCPSQTVILQNTGQHQRATLPTM